MRRLAIALLLTGCTVGAGRAQAPVQLTGPTDDQIKLADIEVRRLVTLLRLEPGMSIADVGAGLGAWAMRFARWTGTSGRVFATDIDETPLTILRTIVAKDALSNVTVITGAADSTNLPAACCDAILIRNVFHYVTEPAAMIRSLAASLKPGGRLAIVDFPPRPNSTVPPGVPANRGGNGVPPDVVESEVGAVLRHVTTVPNWSPEAVPDWVPKNIAPPFVVIFEKAK
jgi:ubiquinone/menaquinone biosynthesis C-methylase UbiE